MPLHSLPPFVLSQIAIAGCAPPPEPGTAAMWLGHTCVWDRLSHRVAVLESRVLASEANLDLRGGPWSTGDVFEDTPTCTLSWATVAAPGLQTTDRWVELSTTAEGPAEVVVTVPVPGDEWREGAWIGAVPLGVRFETALTNGSFADGSPWPWPYDPADGWTPRALGSSVELDRVEGGVATVRVRAHFAPGPLDRDDMNEAVPSAEVRAEVGFALWSIPGASLVPADLEGAAYTVVDPPFTDFPAWPESGLTATWADATEPAVPILRGWHFLLSSSIGNTGRYLRSWRAVAVPGTPAHTPSVDGHLSISSAFEEGDLDVSWRFGLDVLSLPAAAEVRVGVAEGRIEGPGPVVVAF